MANVNGNGYLKPILIGVGIVIISSAILGTAATTISQREMQVTLETVKEEVQENTKRTEGIDVMQKQVDIIEENVGKILEKLEK